MSHEFDRDYWEAHWRTSGARPGVADAPPHPYLARELGGVGPARALDAGCGEGAEAIWLARAGWQVIAADISSHALARAAERASATEVGSSIEWVEADLSTWEPAQVFDLVTTHYAHPTIGQLVFYERLAQWVAPGGTLLVVGHRHDPPSPGPGETVHPHTEPHRHRHRHRPPSEASVTAADIVARLDPSSWMIHAADEPERTLERHGTKITLHDVVVRASRVS